MHAVGDDLGRYVVTLRTGGNGAGLSMMQRGHSIEQVRHMARASIEGRARVIIARARMGYGDAHVMGHLADELQVARLLGSHVNQLDEALRLVLQAAELFDGGAAHVCGVLRAHLIGGDIGTFHVDAHDPGLPRCCFMRGHAGHDGSQALFRKRHGGRADGGHATACLVCRDGGDALIGRIAEIVAHGTVEVHIYQAWDHITSRSVQRIGSATRAARYVSRCLDAGEGLPLHHHIAFAEALTVEHLAVCNAHTRMLLSNMEGPSACAESPSNVLSIMAPVHLTAASRPRRPPRR